ncbi:MAG: hypothetical protein V4674_02085 [Patescibacteria group bacterium]
MNISQESQGVSLGAKLLGVLMVLVVGFGIARADWTAPGSTPPGCTAGTGPCEAPINVSSTNQTKSGGLTVNGNFIPPRLATASLPTCNTANRGSTVFDTTAGKLKNCDGTVWKVLASDDQIIPPVPFPSGAVMSFDIANTGSPNDCPAGWTEFTAAEGRSVVGLQYAGTLRGTAGTPLTDRQDRPTGSHTHYQAVQDHPIYGYGHTHPVAASFSGSGTGSTELPRHRHWLGTNQYGGDVGATSQFHFGGNANQQGYTYVGFQGSGTNLAPWSGYQVGYEGGVNDYYYGQNPYVTITVPISGSVSGTASKAHENIQVYNPIQGGWTYTYDGAQYAHLYEGGYDTNAPTQAGANIAGTNAPYIQLLMCKKS